MNGNTKLINSIESNRKELARGSMLLSKNSQLDLSLYNWLNLEQLIKEHTLFQLGDAFMLCNTAQALAAMQNRYALNVLGIECTQLLTTLKKGQTTEQRKSILGKFIKLTHAMDRALETVSQNVLATCTQHAKAVDNKINGDAIHSTPASEYFLDVLNGKSIKSVAATLNESEEIVKDNILAIAIFLSRICFNREFVAKVLQVSTITALRKLKVELTNLFENHRTIVKQSTEAAMIEAENYGLPTYGL